MALRRQVWSSTAGAVTLAAAAFWTASAVDAAAQSSVASDRAALEALYDATGGAGWTDRANWRTSAPLNQWYGVTTDADGRVAGLHLRQNGLAGRIPGELGDLVNLRSLNLAVNALTGSLPDGLGSLVNLESVNLRINRLTGPVPAWGNMTRLRWLLLDGNDLSSPIPGELGSLVNLESLDLGHNDLTGSVPAWLADLSRLRQLNLGPNDLTGPIPGELGSLADLRMLGLAGNALSGPIPDELGNLLNLRGLNLTGNGLTGPVPAWLGNLTHLVNLGLAVNELTGSIPDELGNLVNLEWLDLFWNGLTGPIPATLGNLVNLTSLRLQGNELIGPVPARLGNLTRLRTLDLGNNALTGRLPDELGSLVTLAELYLDRNALTGPVPAGLGNLTRLERLRLDGNDLAGPLPRELENLENLVELDLSYNWGVSGSLPPGLWEAPLEKLDIFLTQACAPGVLRGWLATIEFTGRRCDRHQGTDVTIDVAVVYTPAARRAAGGAAAIEAEIDLMIAETNQAYEASGVRHRVALVARSEVEYDETESPLSDLQNPSDGHMDEVHALRDRVLADLVHLITNESASFCGLAVRPGAFGLTVQGCGSEVFAHELGHNMGLWHDRYQVHRRNGGVSPHPAYGYVNQPGLAAGAPSPRRWRTVMAYNDQCVHADVSCRWLFRFSNPRQRHNGDPMGIPYGADGSGMTGPSDAAAILNAAGPVVAAWREPAPPNQPPAPVRILPDRMLAGLGSALDVDVSRVFIDPDGDALTYTASSSAPHLVTARASGARLTVTAVGAGTATIRVTAVDPGGLSGSQSFGVRVTAAFTDDPLRPGETPVKAIHFTELRTRIDNLRRTAAREAFAWADPGLTAGVTRARLPHLLELRAALAAAYAAAGRPAPGWTDPAPTGGETPIRAAHLTELRAAVMAME